MKLELRIFPKYIPNVVNTNKQCCKDMEWFTWTNENGERHRNVSKISHIASDSWYSLIRNIYRKEKYIPLTKFAIPKNVRKVSNDLQDHFLSMYENICYRVLYWRWKNVNIIYYYNIFSRLPSNFCKKK